MTSEKPSKPTKLCPTCGTRVSEDATRCLVCGTDFTSSEKSARPEKGAQGSRIPEITLSLPAVLGLFTVFLAIGAGLVWFATRGSPGEAAAQQVSVETPELVVTESIETPTLTPTLAPPTATFTPQPSPTPASYTVKLGELCSGIAFNFGVSIQSIVAINPELNADCSNLREGQVLFIPQPTPTPTEQPTATLSPDEATRAACDTVEYEVQESDTLGGIAANYAVPAEAIREFNGLVGDFVRSGQMLLIPLCDRLPTPGPTPTPTPPPPYEAPNLLLPINGTAFTGNDPITLQWASVGTLRPDESYAVTIEDLTAGDGIKHVEYVSDTKYIVASALRPQDNLPHVFQWTVTTMRATGTDEDGNTIYESAGAKSSPGVFSWSSSSSAAAPTTAP